MRSRTMLGTALLGAMSAMGAFATDSEAAGYRGVAPPVAYRPAVSRLPVQVVHPPAFNFRMPVPTVRPSVGIPHDLHPAVRPTPTVHTTKAASHPIPGVNVKTRPDFDRELRHDRNDHRWDRDLAHWWDHDFGHRVHDGFGRWGEHGLRYLESYRFHHWGDYGFGHLGDHFWRSVWDHGYRPFGDLAWRYMDDHGFLPWLHVSTPRVLTSRR